MEKAIRRYMPIFVLPTFCAFILGFIVPFIMGIWLSFCEFTTVTDAKFVGLSNYIEAFKDTIFRHSFWYTVLFAVASLIVINVVAFALALALTQKMKGTNIFPYDLLHAEPDRRNCTRIYLAADLQRNPGEI